MRSIATAPIVIRWRVHLDLRDDSTVSLRRRLVNSLLPPTCGTTRGIAARAIRKFSQAKRKNLRGARHVAPTAPRREARIAEPPIGIRRARAVTVATWEIARAVDARRLAVLVLVATVAAIATRAAAQDDGPGPWEIAVGTQVGAPAGFVKVGEHDRSGDALHFHRDLGVDTFEVVDANAAYHLTPADTFRVRFDYTFLYGGTTLDEDTAFNGATLAGGTHLDTRPVFTRLSGFYDHQLIAAENGLRVAAGVGLTYVYLHFKLHGTLAANTLGKETQEDFYAQELPVPLGVIRAEYPLTDRLLAFGWADGGALPRVDSLRTEGGQVTETQGHADVFLGLRYAVTPALAVDGGYTFTYFAQHQTSGEDNNEILFLGHGFGLNVGYRF